MLSRHGKYWKRLRGNREAEASGGKGLPPLDPVRGASRPPGPGTTPVEETVPHPACAGSGTVSSTGALSTPDVFYFRILIIKKQYIVKTTAFPREDRRETHANAQAVKKPQPRSAPLAKVFEEEGGGLEGGRRNFLKKVSPSPLQFHSITNAFAACVAAGMFPSTKRRTTSSAAGSCLRKASCASGLSRPRTQFTVSSPPCGERPMPRRRR